MRFFLPAVLFVTAAPLAAQSPLQSPATQINLAVQSLPNEFRAGATVLGFNAAGKLVQLRAGKGVVTCLANDPAGKTFHVACYANSMEPFMARGRELRAQGRTDAQVDTARFAEAKSGKLPLPKLPAALWKLDGPLTAVDMKTGKIGPQVMPTYVLYIPYATSASTGLPVNGVLGSPWLMLPGTPKAHVMFAMTM